MVFFFFFLDLYGNLRARGGRLVGGGRPASYLVHSETLSTGIRLDVDGGWVEGERGFFLGRAIMERFKSFHLY